MTTALDGVKTDIVYIPEGEHVITPSVNGKPKEITCRLSPDRGEEVAALFQDQLSKLNGKNVKPFLDFGHEEGKSAGEPLSFHYEAGRGLILKAEWSGSGKEGIESKDWRYFSPTFLINSDGEPSGLPEYGSIGALVNDPAFTEIERVAAARAKQTEPTSNKPKAQNTMSDLVKAGILTTSEAAAEDAVTVAASRYTALKEDSANLERVKAENKDLKDKIEAQANAQADEAIADAVKAGRISPKDEDTKKFWHDQLVENPVTAKKMLEQVEAKHANLGDQIVTPKGGQVENTVEIQASNMVKAGKAASNEEAMANIFESNPAAYDEYVKNLNTNS